MNRVKYLNLQIDKMAGQNYLESYPAVYLIETIPMFPYNEIFRQRLLPLVAALVLWVPEVKGDTVVSAETPKMTREQAAGVPPEVHSMVGDSSAGWTGKLRITNIGKRQQHDCKDTKTLDSDIFSPKSVNFHPDGRRCYVNSLEGCRTVVYSLPDLEKLKVIEHSFPSSNGPLWADPSGYYPFTHYGDGASRAFQGKPVEGAFSHSGRYFWVPYYRRTFDLNAQDPSAIAVIDTDTDSIIKMFETGPLPKMVAYSPVAGLVAVAHWGDNTVGLIDVRSDNPAEWRHKSPLAAGKKLLLDFPLDRLVDRDKESGYKLRGTVFTPDGRYLIVSSMGGPMHIFDVVGHEYLGYVNSGYGIRHLIVSDGILYGSRNIAGTVVAIPLDSLMAGITAAVNVGRKSIDAGGWQTCKVGGGARTVESSPDGKLLFVACNSSSEVCAVDVETMTVVDRIRVDSYPVGLDVSEDGSLMAVTSQGRKGFGGNALNLFRITRPGLEVREKSCRTVSCDNPDCDEATAACEENDSGGLNVYMMLLIAVVLLSVSCLLGVILWKRNKQSNK